MSYLSKDLCERVLVALAKDPANAELSTEIESALTVTVHFGTDDGTVAFCSYSGLSFLVPPHRRHELPEKPRREQRCESFEDGRTYQNALGARESWCPVCVKMREIVNEERHRVNAENSAARSLRVMRISYR